MAETETEDSNYRPVNIEFLEQGGDELFDIFYRTESFGEVKFVKFASSSPEHQDKVRNILESGETEEEFYIHEEDLFKYYKHATNTLRAMAKNPRIPQKEKAQKVYEVSKTIMEEFFEYNASNKILTSSEEVMSIMDECLSHQDVGFSALSEITNKDYYTYTHSVNVGLYCMTFGIKIKLPPDDIKYLGLGGMLHDVGKSKVPYEILNKDGKLTDEEFNEIQSHAPMGQEILQGMECYNTKVCRMAGEHHEKYSGGGYPNDLEGEKIHPFARVCKIMDVYDALTTRRSYKKAMAPFDALILMKKQMGPEFDPKLLDKFIMLMGPDL